MSGKFNPHNQIITSNFMCELVSSLLFIQLKTASFPSKVFTTFAKKKFHASGPEMFFYHTFLFLDKLVAYVTYNVNPLLTFGRRFVVC